MKEIKTIKGIYSQNQSGDFGFVDPILDESLPKKSGKVKGYFVHFKNKKDALDGDEVLATVKIFKGREEAIIEKIIKRTDKTFIGKFREGKSKKFGFVILKNKGIKKDIFIPGKLIGNAKDGDMVGIIIKKWEGKSPEGKIVENLGKGNNKDIEVRGIILEAGFKQGFSETVLNEVGKYGPPPRPLLSKEGGTKTSSIDKKELIRRKDFRNLFTFTIDGEDAKDLDDAISLVYIPQSVGDHPQPLLTKEGSKAHPNTIVGREGGYYKLFVHIADVTHYVKEKSSLDKEAIKRATSVYLPDRVLPMLPENLSNGLCSLNPDTDKLTLTCEMHISENGELRKTIVYESIIKSDFRLTYKEVDEITSGKIKQEDELMFGKKVNSELLETISLANKLKNNIGKYRKIAGTLDFDFPEIKLEIDNNKNIKSINKYPRYDSNKLIEMFMVTCNEAISRKFFRYPFLYRIHEAPSFEDIEKLQGVLDMFGVNFKLEKATTKEFSDLLERISSSMSSSKKIFLENNVLRALSKAIYSSENLGHFGLGLKYYSHFTSPIRRYPDLQIHRIIKEKLSGGLNKDRLHHYKTILDGVANSSSTQERKAEKLEYKVKDYYIVQYYKNRVGERFSASIVGVIPVGFFVQLENGVEGLVETGDKYRIKEEFGVIEDVVSKRVYKLGDEVEVELVGADEERIRLNFGLI